MAEATEAQVRALLVGKTPDERGRIASAAGENISQSDAQLDCRIAAEMVRQLADDAVERVRVTLAESVRHSRFLPKDVALKLAYDIDSVAVPFMASTNVFDEIELMKVAEEVAQTVKRAIARRKDLSEKVSEILAKVGDLEVAETLADNHDAQVGEGACETLIDRFTDQQQLCDKLAQRPVLSAAIVAVLLEKVSDYARERLIETHGVSLDFINPVVAEACGNALLTLIGETGERELPMLVLQMRERKELTPQLILEAGKKGHFEFLIHSFSLLAERPLKPTRRLITEGGPKGRRRIYEKVGLPKLMIDKLDQAFVEKFDKLHNVA